MPEQYRFQPGYAVLATGFSATDEHSRLAARIRESVPPLFESVGPIPYRELQRMLDKTHPWGLRCYQNALYLDELSDAAIATITRAGRHPGAAGHRPALGAVPLAGSAAARPRHRRATSTP